MKRCICLYCKSDVRQDASNCRNCGAPVNGVVMVPRQGERFEPGTLMELQPGVDIQIEINPIAVEEMRSPRFAAAIRQAIEADLAAQSYQRPAR